MRSRSCATLEIDKWLPRLIPVQYVAIVFLRRRDGIRADARMQAPPSLLGLRWMLSAPNAAWPDKMGESGQNWAAYICTNGLPKTVGRDVLLGRQRYIDILLYGLRRKRGVEGRLRKLVLATERHGGEEKQRRCELSQRKGRERGKGKVNESHWSRWLYTLITLLSRSKKKNGLGDQRDDFSLCLFPSLTRSWLETAS